jgi:hypothetical protein
MCLSMYMKLVENELKKQNKITHTHSREKDKEERDTHTYTHTHIFTICSQLSDGRSLTQRATICLCAHRAHK